MNIKLILFFSQDSASLEEIMIACSSVSIWQGPAISVKGNSLPILVHAKGDNKSKSNKTTAA